MASASTPRKRSHEKVALEDGHSDSALSSPPSPGTGRGTRSTAPPPADERVQGQSDEDDEDDDDLDPDKPLPPKDWPEFMTRYHQTMQEKNDNERELYQEFAEFLNYFNVWANTSTVHETDRSFARLNTRSAFTQHCESATEDTRLHYQKIVQAFQSALNLLNGS